MPMPYKILEDEATADIAFVVTGKTLDQVFHDSAIALFDTMADRSTIKKKISVNVDLQAKTAERLFIAFLEEIVFLKDSKNMLFSSLSVKLEKTKGYKLNAAINGDKIGTGGQKTKLDVKAITLHMFHLKKNEKGWEAKMVLDI